MLFNSTHKLFVSAFYIFYVSLSISAQNIEIDTISRGVYERKNIRNRQVVPYQYVREADVLWSKIIWRMINLSEKQNLKLYYPEYPMEAQGRYSLIDLIMMGINDNKIRAFHPSADEFNEFKEEIFIKQIEEERFGAQPEIVTREDEDGTVRNDTIAGTYNTKDVKAYLIKEEWFFDKQRSVFEMRVIGLCAIRQYPRDPMRPEEDILKTKLFWVYYPEIRGILASHLAFNPNNDAELISFDDVFMKRYFTGYVFQVSNTYNNRIISQYELGIEALMESERIKETIQNFEMDLWEY